MVAALLHGRTHLNFQEFRQQNHLTFFLHVLGVLVLLQPQVFQSEHQGALWDCLLSFIRLLLVGLARPLPLGSLPSSSPRAPLTGCPHSETARGSARPLLLLLLRQARSPPRTGFQHAVHPRLLRAGRRGFPGLLGPCRRAGPLAASRAGSGFAQGEAACVPLAP